MYKNVHSTLFIIPKNWKQFKWVPAVLWKYIVLYSIHIMVCCTSLKRMNYLSTLTGMTVNERSHAQKTSLFMIQFV